MKKKNITIWIILIVIIAISSPFWGNELFLWTVHGFKRDYLKIDQCLDSGGRWNYEKHECEMNEKKNLCIKIPTGWKIPEDSLFKTKWINENHDGYLRIAADFDRNGFIDSVLLLESNDGKHFGIFAFLFDTSAIKAIEIYNSAKDTLLHKGLIEHPEYKAIDMYIAYYGIRVAPEGKYLTACGKGYFDCEANEPETLFLINPGIDFFHFDAGGTRYFYYDYESRSWKFQWMDD
jgi:hypothetical protein